MPGKIYIEAKPVAMGWKHAYLVYEDEKGDEFVIRGGPESDNPLDFGRITTEIGIPIYESEDNRDKSEAAARGRKEIDLRGQDATAVWEQMRSRAQDIDDLRFGYRAVGVEDSIGLGITLGRNEDYAQNSNSTIATVLESAGLNPLANLPDGVNVGELPGIHRSFPITNDNDVYYTAPFPY